MKPNPQCYWRKEKGGWEAVYIRQGWDFPPTAYIWFSFQILTNTPFLAPFHPSPKGKWRAVLQGAVWRAHLPARLLIHGELSPQVSLDGQPGNTCADGCLHHVPKSSWPLRLVWRCRCPFLLTRLGVTPFARSHQASHSEAFGQSHIWFSSPHSLPLLLLNSAQKKYFLSTHCVLGPRHRARERRWGMLSSRLGAAPLMLGEPYPAEVFSVDWGKSGGGCMPWGWWGPEEGLSSTRKGGCLNKQLSITHQLTQVRGWWRGRGGFTLEED